MIAKNRHPWRIGDDLLVGLHVTVRPALVPIALVVRMVTLQQINQRVVSALCVRSENARYGRMAAQSREHASEPERGEE
jgi:hypothetical protein